jgi:hypothetical protein
MPVTFKMKNVGPGQKIEHVWDPGNMRVVCDIKGELTTDDPKLIQALKDLGYEHTEDKSVKVAEPDEVAKHRGRPRKSGGE